MRQRQLSLGLLFCCAVLVPACSGGVATTQAPSAAPVVSPSAAGSPSTAAPQSAAPTAAATAEPASAAPVTAQPSAAPTTSGSSDLLSLIPAQTGSYTIQAQQVPAELIASYMPGLEGVLTAVGADPGDANLVLAGATGSGTTDSAAIYVLQVPGADTDALVQAEVDRWLSQMVEGSDQTEVTIGGKNVIQVGEQDPSFPKYAKYVYGVGDVVFVIDQAGNDAVVEEVLSALP